MESFKFVQRLNLELNIKILFKEEKLARIKTKFDTKTRKLTIKSVN